jgi:menaquinone-9 beta-reductase
MPKTLRWDVVVVGGGPAGSVTATYLARAGHQVLLLDRARFPRPKPCGECLNPAAVAALDQLGALPAVRAAGAYRLDGWRLVPARGPEFCGSFPADQPGLTIPRAALDAVLLERAGAAGVELRMGAQVTDLLTDAWGVRGVRAGKCAISARLVIGADGLRSVVVRRLGLLRRKPRLRKVALAAHVREVAGLGSRGVMYVAPSGCVGIARVGDGMANVVVVAHGEEVKRVAGNPGNYFDRVLRGVASLEAARRVEDVLTTGPFDWPTRRATANGAMLVGDAAGYYDPFTGQGIYRALHGASLVAAAADAGLRSGDLSATALAPYERARRRAFGSGERVQRLIESVLGAPQLFSAVSGRLQRRPALADALVAVTGDLRPFRSLLAPTLLAQWLV